MVAMVFRLWREAGLNHARKTYHFASKSVFLVLAWLRNQCWQVVNRQAWTLSIPFLHIYYSFLWHKGQTQERSKIWSCRCNITQADQCSQLESSWHTSSSVLEVSFRIQLFFEIQVSVLVISCKGESRHKSSSLQIFSISHMSNFVVVLRYKT